MGDREKRLEAILRRFGTETLCRCIVFPGHVAEAMQAIHDLYDDERQQWLSLLRRYVGPGVVDEDPAEPPLD